MSAKSNKSPDVQNPHDTRLKELFRNKEAFISLLKDCVKPEWVDSLDVDSLKINNTSFILQDFKKKEADIIYEATINHDKVIFYVLLELQNKIDYRMPYRLMLYIVEILRHYYNNADTKERLRKSFKFPAVIPIVFFSGSEKWTVPTNLKEMFNAHERFGDSLINFNYALVDTNGYDEDSVKDFQSRLLKVMMMFESVTSSAELFNAIRKHENDIKKFNDEEIRIIDAAISILSSMYESGEINEPSYAQNSTTTQGVNNMLAKVVANEKKRMRQLKKQAREEEKHETAKVLLDMGMSVEQVAQATRWPVDRVIEVREASVPYSDS